MKIKKAISLILAILMLTSVIGCQDNQQDSSIDQVPESIKKAPESLEKAPKGIEQTPESIEQTPESIEQKKLDPELVEYGEITDPVELEKLWQEYLFDSNGLISNTRDFSSAEEIDALYVARFCWSKYINEHDATILEQEHVGSYLRLFPLETVLEYAKRYFDLDELDVSQINAGNYDFQRKAFLCSIDSSNQPRPSYNGALRGKRLEKATRNRDSTITVVLVQPDSRIYDRILYTDTYTLKQRDDGSLYFASGKREYINNNLVGISGDYQRFEKITGFDGSLDALSMLGETEGGLIFVYTPYNTKKAPALLLLNPESMRVEKSFEIDGSFEATDVNMRRDSIIIRLPDRFIAVDKTLEQSEDILLPEIIKNKLNRDIQYNAKGSPNIFFGGYDVSSDRTQYVYSDEEGLKLYNSLDSSERLLSKTVPIINSELLDNSFHWSPRFVADEQKVITTMTGYEGSEGYTLCDLESGTEKTFGIGSECSSTGLIRYDNGLMEINKFIRDPEDQNSDYKTMYLDFRAGDVRMISLQDPGETGDIRMPDYSYVGQNFAAFITYKRDYSNSANNESYINRLDLSTMQIEPKVISVKATQTHILGVLEDGRLVFWYNLNPSEYGVCITK